MTDFIHSLMLPTCVCTFDGELIDANQAMVADSKACSKFQLLNHNFIDLMVDKTKQHSIVDVLLSGNSVHDQHILLKFFDNTVDARITNVTLLSAPKKWMLMQYYKHELGHQPFIEKYELLLQEVHKIKPYLNKYGQTELIRICDQHKQHLAEGRHKTCVEYIAHQLLNKYPCLSPSDLHICAFISLGFSSHEIVHFLGCTLNNLRVHLHRICKKIKVSSREELYVRLQHAGIAT